MKESSLANAQVSAQVLPTSAQIEQYYRDQFKGTITLAVNREAGQEAMFPIDSEGRVSLILAFRKNENDVFRNAWTGRSTKLIKEKDVEYYKNKVLMSGKGGVLYLLKVDDWCKEFTPEIPLPKKDEEHLSYIRRVVLNLFDCIDGWLLKNTIVTLRGVPDDERSYDVNVSFVEGSSAPSFLKFYGHISSSISLISPAEGHPDEPLLWAAWNYEKRISSSALEEAQKAHAGCVDIPAYLEKVRDEYLKVLRAASPEFRKQFNII